MVVRGKEFDEIYDLVGIRVDRRVGEGLLGGPGLHPRHLAPGAGPVQGLHQLPKFNLYQSLHTTVIGLDGKPIEVQVRTHEMHRRAEYGIAAHWGYKEQPSRRRRSARPRPAGATGPGRSDGKEAGHGRAPRRPSRTPAQRAEMAERDRRAERLALAKETSSTTAEIEWMQRIVDFQNETTDPIEFLEALKLDLEQDEVYVFTPKGKVIALPANATPVDFAYAIHTEVGHRCIGAQVNGRLVPLDTPLNSADTVEIFTSKAADRRALPGLAAHRGLVPGPQQDPPVVLPGAPRGRHRARARGADQGAAPGGPARSRSWPPSTPWPRWPQR